MSAPLSTIYICEDVRINSRYEHSIWFESADAQKSHFMGKVVKTLARYTFLRREWNIKIEATMNEAKKWNYLFFQNTPDPKYYYYFINEVRYVNDNTVELVLEMDVLQTYLFDMELLPSFVERQHTETDEAGEHTVDEGLDTGEHLVYDLKDVTELNDLAIVILSTAELQTATNETFNDVFGKTIDGVYSGLGVYAMSGEKGFGLSAKLLDISRSGATEGIVAMFMYPKALIQIDERETWEDDSQVVFKQVVGINPITYSWQRANETKLDSYTPRNKKLFCYPYNFMYVTNNAGGSAIYKFENTPVGYRGMGFQITGAIGQDGGVRLNPLGYFSGGQTYGYEYGLTLGSFPTCAWNNDSYMVWLAQNQNTLQAQTAGAYITLAGGAVATLGSALTGNVFGVIGGAGTMVGACHKIYSQVAAMNDREVQPNQAKGQYSASTNIVNDKQTFTLMAKCVKPEMAAIIDDFFTMYGYKLNRVQVPNIHARSQFTYVKTIGCHIRAHLNNADTVKIESIFDNGITFWTNGDNVGAYMLPNDCL